MLLGEIAILGFQLRNEEWIGQSFNLMYEEAREIVFTLIRRECSPTRMCREDNGGSVASYQSVSVWTPSL